ncbi:MAG: hypothetical protein ACREIT_05700 [Tepidisphaeraceae bacterium]
MTAPPAMLPPRPVLPWAIFLGMSWTWCIGMFLPVLLVREYGPWAWVVFAAPNVVGAAAMGAVMNRVRDPEAFVARHRVALAAFSCVTVAFHFFFATWMIASVLPAGVAWVLAAVAVALLAGWRRERIDLLSAGVVLAFSTAAFVAYVVRVGPSTPPAPPDVSVVDLFALAVVCAFGFALCPYLDRTFHRAYLATYGRPAVWAFGVGFGLFFLAMIVFTLCYTGPLDAVVRRGPGAIGAFTAWVVGLHMVVQSGFTAAVHARGREVMFPIAAAAIAGIFIVLGHALDGRSGLTAGEISYRLFMSFYGLIFPAYAWLCMIPTRDGVSGPTADRLTVLAVVVAPAAPFYWLAFIEGRMPWVLVGVGIVLLARLFVRNTSSRLP